MRHAGSLKPRPWQVQVDGMVGKPGTLDLEALLAPVSLEERIYRMRCVEAWSMVIPWVGVPLSSVLSRFEPLGSGAPVNPFVVAGKVGQLSPARSRTMMT